MTTQCHSKSDEIHFIASAKALVASLPVVSSPLTLAPWHAPPAASLFQLTPVSLSASIGSGQSAFGYYVQYDMTLQCPITSRAWTIHKRYSQLLKFRSQLTKLHATSPSPSLACLLQLPFPKKALDSEKPSVIAERMQRFQTFVEHVWSLYASCVVPTSGAPEEAAAVIACLHEFLSVPEAVLAISVRHIDEMPQDMDPCVVCLGEFDVDDLRCPSAVLALSCGHVFHRDCLQQWCAVAVTCPTCRRDVGGMASLQLQ
ncbi:hypothetical protein SDRG_12970 [Saprolegnia diclina VS20]|uniref:RING-type domain-containing protein n=1 Tax=Saprolegnia diclina (strain VS20) TaxID=1156394 RepID=T0Q3X7_SAPDV|nr:hypothetical protein SDRG_12970 [Saprolegnia diclina VS20]EQC29301.1 hypothetical protein SDRG_12970 [Saprolegnia diclina VS20]|eukprot:XP_008617275.1 hypothetical protein SDRG_12970 [Saprolegnia diclina VS20]